MSPRERVLAAINLETPDRTPCDCWAEPPTLNHLLAYTGLKDEERLLSELSVDIRHLGVSTIGERSDSYSYAGNRDDAPLLEREIGDGVYQNFWGERYVYQNTKWGPYRQDLPGALADAKSIEEIEEFPWPTPDIFDYSGLKEQCSLLEQYAIIYGFADIWQRPGLVRGWENMFLDLVDHPDWVHFLCRKFTDFYLEDYTRAMEASEGKIDIFLILSDLAGQNGPLISLDMFREFVAPYIKEMVDLIHSLGAFALYHSDGDVSMFIPDLIDMGVDILDPIQPTGENMSPERLKADFGERLCFHGGIDIQELMPYGTPQQVKSEVRRYCEILGSGGGYILAPGHLFQPDVPMENIIAFYEKRNRNPNIDYY
ncbi:TPA: hypothetical protein EYP66_20190 [Candidatus Poribacteria bacterium]|nr:hypothetical protein [Candidatus Poribacteria bacterium]